MISWESNQHGPTGQTEQSKVTQRLWHGLDVQYIFTWAKELQQGVEGGTVNDVFNRSQNKSISGFSRPLVSTLSLNYRVPAPAGNKIVSEVLRDWAVGATVTYAGGLPILAPTSTNNLSSLLFRSTYYNRVPGVDPSLKDLNCHCIDPTKDLVLNKDAWANPVAGQWGTAALYYNDYRYEHGPRIRLQGADALHCPNELHEYLQPDSVAEPEYGSCHCDSDK